MIESQFSKTHEPGTWNYLYYSGGLSATFVCPFCRTNGILTDHEIDYKGVVSPSVQCMNVDCSFHDHVQLKGWSIEHVR